jgi:hypothetical protein
MDLKALIAKMDQIESKQLLNEGFPTVADAKARADKEKTTGKFDKKEIKPGVTQYTRKSSTFDDGGKDSDQKKAEKKTKNEDIKFNSSIARGLIEEFGYEIEEDNVEEATSPWANDPAKDAAWKALSPEDQKWLGGADPTDSAILARAPNKGKPAAPSAAPSAEAPAVSNPQNPGGMSDEEMLARQNPGGMSDEEMLARQQTAAEPATAAAPTIDPAKLKRFQELLAKASTPAAAPAAAPATGAATKPAAPGFANTGGGAAVGNPNMAKQGAAKESVTFEDDQTLLAIKNIRF